MNNNSTALTSLNDGHSILPTPMIYDANVGEISCTDLTQIKTRLLQHLQYLLKDTANPLNSVTIEKFSEPEQEEIAIGS